MIVVGFGKEIDKEDPRTVVGGGDGLPNLVVSITIPNETLLGVGCAS